MKKIVPAAQKTLPCDSNSISVHFYKNFGHIGGEACLTVIGGMDTSANMYCYAMKT